MDSRSVLGTLRARGSRSTRAQTQTGQMSRVMLVMPGGEGAAEAVTEDDGEQDDHHLGQEVPDDDAVRPPEDLVKQMADHVNFRQKKWYASQMKTVQ